MSTPESAGHWRVERDADGILWLALDRADAGVNTLSAEVIEALDRHIEAARAEPPRGMVIHSAKPGGFIAGADVREFLTLGDANEAVEVIRRAQGVLDRIEALPFPTVSLIHGYCLGGGLELALATRYRIAEDDPGTRIGLPEVNLGIHPGFGGTVRATRLLGPLPALDLMLSGRSIDARAARRIGLVDHAVPRRVLRRAARQIVLTAPEPRQPHWSRRLPGAGALRPWVARYLRRRVAARAPEAHYPAPYALIGLWERHARDPRRMYEEEAASVARLVTGETARNLIRVFFLRERLKSIGKADGGAVRHVHVVGAGVMGGDIAAWCALQGLRVTLQDRSPDRIAPAIGRASSLFARRLRDPRRARAAMDRLMPDIRGDGVGRADVVIEAIHEDAGAKQALFRELEPRMRADALLATNTSSIPLETLGEGLERPGRLVGLHFFNPVARMQLVEVVRGADTDADVVRRGAAFARAIDRLPLPVASRPGFLVNRVLMPYLLEAIIALEEGMSAGAIDRAAVDFGMPVGPIELADSVGLDVCLSVADNLGTPDRPTPGRLRRLVEEGRLGRKSGRGFYDYRDGKPVRPRAGQDAHPATALDDRLILPLVNEAVACLREGIVDDVDALDAGVVFGTGFAPFRGGPLHYALNAGPDAVSARLEALARTHGARFAPDEGWEALRRPAG